jgi:hypothetical protein
LKIELPSMSSCILWFLLLQIIQYSFSFSLPRGGLETDRHSLLAFKAQLSDPTNKLSSWNESLHFCQWSGVTCGKRHQRVIELDLRSSQLAGRLSPHIGNLSFLTKPGKQQFQQYYPLRSRSFGSAREVGPWEQLFQWRSPC